jgi:DNA helicase-2/ATP-dependent DNA helicase PcrA
MGAPAAEGADALHRALDAPFLELFWDFPPDQGSNLLPSFTCRYYRALTGDRPAWILPYLCEQGQFNAQPPASECDLREMTVLTNGCLVAQGFWQQSADAPLSRFNRLLEERQPFTTEARSLKWAAMLVGEKSRLLYGLSGVRSEVPLGSWIGSGVDSPVKGPVPAGEGRMPAHLESALGVFRAMQEDHLPLDLITEEDLESREALGRYEVLILPNAARTPQPGGMSASVERTAGVDGLRFWSALRHHGTRSGPRAGPKTLEAGGPARIESAPSEVPHLRVLVVMVVFYADLHIHSRFSRATSSDSDLEHLALWARRKGISVLGTGDFTHPAWLREIEEKFVPAEPGLFRLRPELEAEVDRRSGASAEPVRFLLEVEISTIYKKGDRTRKVHHLIYVPDLEKARKLIESLSRIGNLASDGRPVLGLDSRHLLEIALESGEGSYLLPAHIWTPWFAALGSKSGFDSIEECYGDLSPEIFAVETGLSSDPEMNWRISALDRYRLVSNSDAHSPPKIAREACAFDVPLDYFAIRDALRTGAGYRGTVEFFPEEGKYHLDGHRECGVSMTPEETRSKNCLCPTCGKPLTLRVMHRVSELADREEPKRPSGAAPYQNLVPLDEVLSEIHGVGPASKAVRSSFEALLARLGSEPAGKPRSPFRQLTLFDAG